MLVDTNRTMNIEDEFVVRAPTLGDLEEAVELFDACAITMFGAPETLLSEVRSEWLLPEFDLETAARLVRTPEGRPVGYVEVWDIDTPPVRIWVWGRVHPEYEDRGIGTYLMRWAERRARQAVKTVPDGIQVAMQAGAYHGYDPAQRLLAAQGMEPVRYFRRMTIDMDEAPPSPRWPRGIEVRPMAGEHETYNVVKAVNDAFQDHWGHVERPLEEEYERWMHRLRTDEAFDPTLWFLALDRDEIAGVSLCWPNTAEDPEMGWVATLGVRRPWRRQGIGLALLHHSFGEFYRRGVRRAGLGVDADSLTGATRLYEKAGMRATRQFDVYEKILRAGKDLTTQQVEDVS